MLISWLAFSFIFYTCLISQPSSRLWASACTSFLAEDLCRNLASMCRMYNDYGSASRDTEEGNLNSMNFPEFVEQGRYGTKTAKLNLLWIIEYEKKGLKLALEMLRQELGEDAQGLKDLGAVKMFVKLTNLYGEIYVLRDIGTRTMER